MDRIIELIKLMVKEIRGFEFKIKKLIINSLRKIYIQPNNVGIQPIMRLEGYLN